MTQGSCFAAGAVAFGNLDADLQGFWICVAVATGAALLIGAGFARAPWHPELGEAPVEYRRWWLGSLFAGVLLGGWWGYAGHLAGFDRLAFVHGEFVMHRRFHEPQMLAPEAIEDVRLKLPPKSGEEGAGLVLYTAEKRYESVSMPLSEARALKRRMLGCRGELGR